MRDWKDESSACQTQAQAMMQVLHLGILHVRCCIWLKQGHAWLRVFHFEHRTTKYWEDLSPWAPRCVVALGAAGVFEGRGKPNSQWVGCRPAEAQKDKQFFSSKRNPLDRTQGSPNCDSLHWFMYVVSMTSAWPLSFFLSLSLSLSFSVSLSLSLSLIFWVHVPILTYTQNGDS